MFAGWLCRSRGVYRRGSWGVSRIQRKGVSRIQKTVPRKAYSTENRESIHLNKIHVIYSEKKKWGNSGT